MKKKMVLDETAEAKYYDEHGVTLQIQAIKKVATMKSIPYQTLIRHWLSENLRKELHIK